MIKSLLIYGLVLGALFFGVYFLQTAVVEKTESTVRFNLWDVNLFFAVVSTIICVHLKVFSNIKSLQPQLGYIYLPTLFIKGGLFFLGFKDTVFAIENFTLAERLCLLSALIVFLVIEVFFVVEILKENEPKILS